MATIPLFRMEAPSLDRGRVRSLAESLRLRGTPLESADAAGQHDDERVLVQAGPCARLAGALLYVHHAASLGAVHGRPLAPERAARWLDAFLTRQELRPQPPAGESGRLELSPWSRVSEAVVFDGRERRRVPARTEAGVRIALNGVPVSGPRTRIRAVFAEDELPILLHVAAWERLEIHAEAELIREHDAIAALERSLRGRTDCDQVFQVHGIRLVYAATEEYRGSPDLLAPYYLIEIAVRPRKDHQPETSIAPRRLLRVPAWRWPVEAGPAVAPTEEPTPRGGRRARRAR
jgi:hypothetical protein